MSDLIQRTFEGAQVRILEIDGAPWFVAADVLAVLDLSRSSIQALDEDEKGVHSMDTLGGTQNVGFINEPGLYSLVLRSRKPEAKPFKRWVTHEVLPSIRRTGGYQIDVTSTAGLIDLAQQFLETAKKLAAAETQLRVIEPKADAWDELASADGDYEVADAAKILARAGIETGRQRLFGQLEEVGWIFRGAKGKWRAYQTAVDNGYLAEKPQSHYHPRTGELVLDPPQVRVTVRGLERLRARLATSKELVA